MVSHGDLLGTSGAIEDEEDYFNQIIEHINERYQGDIGNQARVVIESITREIKIGNRCESLATYAKQREVKFLLIASSQKTLETSHSTCTKRIKIEIMPLSIFSKIRNYMKPHNLSSVKWFIVN